MPIQLSGSGSITGVSTLTSLASLDVTGSVSVGGTLVYDDVTNIDSLGIVTARSDVHVGAGLSVTGISTFNDYLDINGDINIDGSQITYTSSSNQLKFADDASLKFGDGNDLQIYHNGNATYISNYNGTLFIDQEADDGTIALRSDNGSGSYIEYIECVGSSGEVRLYHYSDRKLTTKSTGVDVTGTVTASGTGGGAASLGSHLDLGDNQKVRLGASDDLDMYHDGTDTYIRNATGQLLIRGNDIKLNNYLGTKTHAEFADGGLTTGAIDLSAISSSISDTAVDIFVYDTRKDSDGGDWRKRTQHTSWYNETLNTSTRGSRKEFPAVAVIVAESNQVTIYDGDDPDLPMWMVFNQATNYIIYTTITSVYMLNGKLIVGTNPNAGDYYDGGIKVFDFISEFIRGYAWSYSPHFYNLNISQRNYNSANSVALYSNTNGILINTNVNDVAMTVLPNAPIDDVTGLPVPTIAVATNNGISVIRDDGTIFDINDSNGARKCYDVSFTKDHKLMHTGDLGAGSTHAGNVFVTNILTADRAEYDNHDNLYRWYSTFQYYPRINGGNTFNTRVLDPIDVGGHHYAMADVGVSLIEDGTSTFAGNTNGMVAYATTSYNTGYQHGDIRGAFLSDTDATNITSGEILSNGDFTNGTTGWTVQDAGEGSISVSSNQLTLNNSTSADPPVSCYQQISLEVGKYYNLISSKASGLDVVVNITTATANTGGTGGYGNVIYHQNNIEQGATFLATHATMYCYIRVNTNATGTAVMNSVSIRKAEEDRSHNNAFLRDKASALTINGTITKSAVATGADLVAYSGFSGSNYLQQPHNSGLDFGTGDFSIMFWYKATAGDYTAQCFLHRGDGGVGTWGSGKIIQIEFNTTNLAAFLAESAFSSFDTVAIPGAQAATGQWQHYTLIRRGTFVGAYLDGELKDSTLSSRDLSNTSAKTWIGERPNNTRPLDTTSLALFRMSASAPSDEQIKKIYKDEKVLFQENAKATLYGSSDAVTALAYDEDTELLHVGTSSGRSDFQGLRRINNTTTAVTTAISASDDLIAEQ